MRAIPPSVIAEGPPEVLDDYSSQFRAAGFLLRLGWTLPKRPWDLSEVSVAYFGAVTSHEDAAAALLAAARGARVVIAADAEPDVVASLFEDLSRLGPVQYDGRSPRDPLSALDPELRHILDILAQGGSLEDTARQLNYSRRTVDRRLAATRSLLGVRTTAEAIMLARRARRLSGAHSKQKLE
jgi:DNA-binding CsgD family transcriptional regulator